MNHLDALATRWKELKDAELEARDARIAIEERMLGFFELKDEGSATTKTGMYKITIRYPVYRSFDAERWEEIRDRIAPQYWPVKVVTVLDEPMCKRLKEQFPEAWLTASEAITEKPGKPSFTITEVE